MIALVLAAVLSLPPGAEAVRIGEDAWPEKVERVSAGERAWWWSQNCAPQLLTSDAATVECIAPIARRVQAVDRASGKKLPGVRVVWGTDAMRTDLPDAMLPFAIADANGEATLLLPRDGKVRVRVDGPRAASWWQNVAAGDAALRITTVPATSAQLQLTIAGSEPATHALVQLEIDETRSWAISRDGRVLLPNVPPVPLRVTAWSEGSAPLVQELDAANLPRTLELPRGVTIRGRVVDARRRPIEGAAIEAIVSIGKLPRGLRRRARSTRAGTFVVRGVPIGSTRLQATKPGHALLVRGLEVDSDFDAGDVMLRSARRIALRVLDSDGIPVSGATVRVQDGPSATSGRDGIATIDGAVADEPLNVHIAAKGFRATDTDVAVDAKLPLDVELSRGVRVMGRVVNAKSGTSGGPGVVLLNNNGAQRVVAFDESGAIDIGGLDEGKLSLEVRAQALAPHSFASREVVADEVWDLGTLALEEGASLAGTVVDRANGRPIAGARIRALRRDENEAALAYVMQDWIAATTNDDGTFTIRGLAERPHVVLVDAPGFAQSVLTVSEAETEIALDRARTVIVECTPVRRCGSEARLLDEQEKYPWTSTSATLTEGRARIVTAAPGRAKLRLIARGEVLHEREVQIASASETTIRIELATATLRGTVASAGRPRRDGGTIELRARTASSAPLPIYLEYRTPDGHVTNGGWQTDLPSFTTAPVDDAGNFLFEELEPGEYEATYRRGTKASPPIALTVRPGSAHLTLEVAPGELHGRVLHDDGRPVPFAAVQIVDAAGTRSVVQSDQFGRFETFGLAEGRAVVRAGEGTPTTVDVDSRHAADIEIVMRAALR